MSTASRRAQEEQEREERMRELAPEMYRLLKILEQSEADELCDDAMWEPVLALLAKIDKP